MDTNKVFANELALSLCSLGDQQGSKIIAHNFRYLIRKICGSFRDATQKVKIDFTDLEIVGAQSLRQAIETYADFSVPFESYAYTVIRRGIWQIVRTQLGPTNSLFHQALSLDEMAYDEGIVTLSDSVGISDFHHRREFSTAMINQIEDFVSVKFAPEELQIIKLKMAGYSLQEISQRLKLSRRSMQTIMQGIKRKYEA